MSWLKNVFSKLSIHKLPEAEPARQVRSTAPQVAEITQAETATKEVDVSPPHEDLDAFDPSNRTIRVFVSSTFKDMMEEREELMTHAWPELRRYCEERHVSFTEVDLRWGISADQVIRNEMLKICLDPRFRECRLTRLRSSDVAVSIPQNRYSGVSDLNSGVETEQLEANTYFGVCRAGLRKQCVEQSVTAVIDEMTGLQLLTLRTTIRVTKTYTASASKYEVNFLDRHLH